jgi:hypothetical protein
MISGTKWLADDLKYQSENNPYFYASVYYATHRLARWKFNIGCFWRSIKYFIALHKWPDVDMKEDDTMKSNLKCSSL